MMKFHRTPTLLRNVSACVVFLLLGAFCLTIYAEPKPPISADKAKWMGYVEDFFMNNYRDVSMRKSLAWGDPKTDDKGNVSITYKYDALIWGKENVVIEDQFSFDKNGKFVDVKKLSKETVKTPTAFDKIREKVEETPETKAADAFLAEAAGENYEKAVALCDGTMKKAMSPDMLKKIWTDLTSQFGKSLGVEPIKTESVLEYIRVHEQCDFERGRAVLMVVVTKDLKISGLFILSADKVKKIPEKQTAGKPDAAASRKKTQEGWKCFMQGNSPEGEPLFVEATKLDPKNANAWQGLGWTQWRQGKGDEAKKSFETCLTLDKRNVAAINGLGQIAQSEGNSDKAIEYWTEGTKVDPRATGPMAALAAVYDGKDDYPNAIKYYEMWFRVEPNNDDAKTALKKVKEKAAMK